MNLLFKLVERVYFLLYRESFDGLFSSQRIFDYQPAEVIIPKEEPALEKTALSKEQRRQRRKQNNRARRAQESSLSNEKTELNSLHPSDSLSTLMSIETFSEPAKEPSLYKIARQPRCLEDDYFKLLISYIVSNVKTLAIGPRKVFLIGSSNFKAKSVNDFDILFHIECPEDRDKARKLIRLFRNKQGGRVTAIDRLTGELGNPKLKQDNRRVIPMTWNRFKLDFILYSDSLYKHAKGLDYTASAFYYDLFEEQMYGFHELSHIHDLDKSILDTIIDPLESFTQDPIRILRGVRVITSEQPYRFSNRCLHAIRAIFSEPTEKVNVFKTIDINRLYYYLFLLCQPQCLFQNVEYLHRLGILTHLFEVVQQDKSLKSEHYISLLWPYMQYYYAQRSTMVLVPIPVHVANFHHRQFGLFNQPNQYVQPTVAPHVQYQIETSKSGVNQHSQEMMQYLRSNSI